MVQPKAKRPAAVAPDDAELVRRVLARDADAFRTIMQRHNRRLYRIARSVLRNNTEAEDAVQEAYVSAFAHLSSYRGESSLAAWLSRITMNEALGRLRHRRPTVDIAMLQETRAEAEIIQFPLSAQTDDPERTMAQRQILQLVEEATDGLPEPYRLVFVTRVIEGMSVEETADLLGIKPETVKNSVAPCTATGARSVGQEDRPGADGCVSVCRPALRANDGCGHKAARPDRIVRNLSPRDPSWCCHVHKARRRYRARRPESIVMSSNVRALDQVRALHHSGKPDRAEVEAAVRTILRWTGDNPERGGLIETPARVTRALEESFVGYAQDPAAILQKSFDETEGYDEMIVLRGVRFESHCEHHMAPILGRAWVAYVPSGRVVGISKLARVVEIYAKRLQIQERLTAQVANTIEEVLKPRGVGVVIKASHHCMTTRGVHKPDSDLVTSRMLGCFRDNPELRQEFLNMTA